MIGLRAESHRSGASLQRRFGEVSVRASLVAWGLALHALVTPVMASPTDAESTAAPPARPVPAAPHLATTPTLAPELAWLLRLLGEAQRGSLELPKGLVDPGAAQVPPPDGPWRLAFADEFNDTTFDTSKWDWKYPRSGDMIYSNWNNGEAQWYKRENISESGGSLKLTAKREDTTSPFSGRTFHYSSGLIHSKPSFNFRYGYMETRMWLPKGSGFWPAFWTWSSNEQWPPEIDAMEFYGDNPSLVYLTYHSDAGADGSRVSASDWTTDWHTFAVKWEPGRLTWYVDGIARKTVNESPSLDMYLIANLAIANGARAPAPNASTPFPSSLKVDYIRVWKTSGAREAERGDWGRVYELP